LELLQTSIKLSHAAISKRDQYAREIGRFENAMNVKIARLRRGFWRMGLAAAVIFMTAIRPVPVGPPLDRQA
jgi:hypothetical protein